MIERKLGKLAIDDWQQVQKKYQELWNFITVEDVK